MANGNYKNHKGTTIIIQSCGIDADGEYDANIALRKIGDTRSANQRLVRFTQNGPVFPYFVSKRRPGHITDAEWDQLFQKNQREIFAMVKRLSA